MKKAIFIAASLVCGSGLSVLGQTTVFNDTFGSSTVNSASPSAPTASSTAYQVLSSATYNTSTPSIGSGNFNFGMVSTTGAGIEAQALFTSSPVTLATVGDYIELNVVFTDTTGIFNSSDESYLFDGLYNSSQVQPVAGGLNGTANTSNSGNATGGAQNWVGYVGQMGYDGASTKNANRSAQTGADNNNQDLVIGSVSSSKGYANPAGTTIQTGSLLATALTSSSVYTESLLITLGSGTSETIENTLYSGSGTGGSVLLQTTGTASGANDLTPTFDSIAAGYYMKTAVTGGTALDVNQISVIDDIQAAPEPSTMALGAIGLGLMGLARFRRR